MKNNIIIPNIYEDISLWNGNTIREYKSLDLKEELNSEMQIIAVQKSTINVLDWILEKMWIKCDDEIKIWESMWRSGFTKIISKDYGQIWIVATKWAGSTESFSNVWDYYMGGNDIWDKVQANWIWLKELSKIPWETLWKFKTELLLLVWLNTLKSVLNSWWKFQSFDLNTLTTKFTPTLTKNAIEKLPDWMKKPDVFTVDSNSELAVQVMELENKYNLVWSVEIVQSWESLIATNNAVIRDQKIIMPSRRDIYTWEFEWKIISELDSDSQISRLAESIQTEIDVIFYEILWKKNNKPKEFINEIQKIMKNI